MDTDQGQETVPEPALSRRMSPKLRNLTLGAFLVLFVGAGGYLAVNNSHAATSPPSSSPIKHVVILYLENHSFDNLLGYWCNQNPARCPVGGMPASVKLSNGVTVTPTTDPDVVPNIDHNGFGQELAMDGGKMDGWQNIPASIGKNSGCDASVQYKCISGYQPSQIKNIVALAKYFGISDNTFSLSDSPSWEGHLYAVAASTDGFWGKNPTPVSGVASAAGWGCDSNKVAPWQATPGGSSGSQLQLVPSCIPDWSDNIKNGGAFEATPVDHIPTIMGRLEGAKLTWKIYSATKGQPGYGIWDICPSVAACLHNNAKNLVADDQFKKDAGAGKLPSFSLITPGGPDMMNSCHNGTSITACDNWLAQITTDVENSPDWSSTAMFITWDDFGGFYDQVYPGTNSNPNQTQEGPRSPVLIVSPYAKAGFTDSNHTTFAGLLSYTEHNFGLAPLGANDAAAYDFSNAFNYQQAPLAPIKLQTHALPASSENLPMFDENDPT